MSIWVWRKCPYALSTEHATAHQLTVVEQPVRFKDPKSEREENSKAITAVYKVNRQGVT